MSDCSKEWGNPGREYAYNPASVRSYSKDRPIPEVTQRSSSWSDAVCDSLGNDLQAVVERTVKQWNGIVRESLRKQTGLRLSTDIESTRIPRRNRIVRSVPVRVVSGLPLRFAKEVQSIKDFEITLLLNRSKLEAVIQGTLFMEKHYQELSKIQSEDLCVAKLCDMTRVHQFAKQVLEYIKKDDRSQGILQIDEDVLGAYFFNIPEIRLYWIVIGVFSQILDLPVEALTVVVLVHELAHAYTHLGYDIDNRDWNTVQFSRSDDNLVEGLAQFYTSVIYEQIEAKSPTVKKAFEQLLERQSDVYREHLKWLEDRSAHLGETVRISMLECRSRGIRTASEFLEILKNNQNNFRVHYLKL